MLPDISIVMPMYNVELYIDKCLNSIVNQTFQNWELIIVDDGSQDNSINICMDYMHVDERIKIINKENKGVSAARNSGIDRVSGRYVIFIDSDDYLERNMLECLYNVAFKSDADIVCCNFYFDYPDKCISNKRTEHISEYNAEEFFASVHLFGDITSYLWNKLIKTTCIGNIKFKEEIIWAEDYIFLMDIFKPDLKTVYIDKKLYHYIQRQSSVCNYGYNELLYINILKLADYIKSLIGIYPQHSNLITSYYLVQEMVILAWMTKNHNYNSYVMKKVKSDIRNNIRSILRVKKIKYRYVVSMLICCFSIKIYIFMYLIMSKQRSFY